MAIGCEVDGCARRRESARHCRAHHDRLKNFGDVLAHIPTGRNWMRAVADARRRAEAERVAYAPTPAEGRGFLWLV